MRWAILILLAAVSAAALPASAARRDSLPFNVAEKLQSAIKLEDDAVALIRKGSFDAAIARLDAARSDLVAINTAQAFEWIKETDIYHALDGDEGAAERLAEINPSKTRVLALLAKARAAKESALAALRPAVAALKPQAAEAAIPFVPSSAPDTFESFDATFTTTSPVVQVESVAGTLGIATSDQGVIAPYLDYNGHGITVEVVGALIIAGKSHPSKFDLALKALADSGFHLALPPTHTSLPLETQAALYRDCMRIVHPNGSQAGTYTIDIGLTRKSDASLQKGCRKMQLRLPKTVSPATTTTATPAHYTCNGQIPHDPFFTNFNTEAVVNGGAAPTFSTGGKAICVTSIITYHWNEGKGSPPGTVGLTRVSGPRGFGSVGPFKTVGIEGQNHAQNVNWQASLPTQPNPTVIDGTYKCFDSEPATWSANKKGAPAFCTVWGFPASSS